MKFYTSIMVLDYNSEPVWGFERGADDIGLPRLEVHLGRYMVAFQFIIR